MNAQSKSHAQQTRFTERMAESNAENLVFSEIEFPEGAPQKEKKPLDQHVQCFTLVLVVEGTGYLNCHKKIIEIKPNMLLICQAGLAQDICWLSDRKIYHLICSTDFIFQYAGIQPLKYIDFLKLPTVYILNDGIRTAFLVIFAHIRHTMSKDLRYQKLILANLVVRIFLNLKGLLPEMSIGEELRQDDKIYAAFVAELEGHFERLKRGELIPSMRVSDYAHAQNITEGHLSHVLRIASGKPAQDWINEKRFSSAIHLLRQPSISIKEISFRLGFCYPSNFATFFKKFTGVTAVEYRKHLLKKPLSL